MKIESIINKKEIEAEAMLRTQFKMELIIYTQDCTYSNELGKRKREEAELGKNVLSGHSPRNDNGATLKEMMKHLKSYYQVIVILYVVLHSIS